MEEELKQKAIYYLCKRFEFTEDKIKHGDWNFLFQKYIEMYIAGATETTKELQEENAELKKKNLSYKDAVDMKMYTNRANKEIADKQLTKAKKILQKVVTDFHNMDCVTVHINKTIAEVEQFLNEVKND